VSTFISNAIRHPSPQFIFSAKNEKLSTSNIFSQQTPEALNLLVTEERCWTLFYMPLHTFLHSLLNALVQIANKMELQKNIFFSYILEFPDRLCDLVVRVPGYRPRGPGSIPGDTRFSEK
jgi:hypothetical protein